MNITAWRAGFLETLALFSPSRSQVWLCIFGVLLCTQSARAAATQYIVVLDASASRDSYEQDQASAFVRKVGQQLNFGDQLVVLRMQQDGLADHNRPFKLDIPGVSKAKPTPLDLSNLQDKRESVARTLPVFLRGTEQGKVLHTDIFATLNLVGEYAGDSQGRRTVLILLSDMLQSTHEFEMEGARRMPGAKWLDAQKARGVLPSLSGACVTVVGVNATTPSGATVRDFWFEYFRRVGATLPIRNYRATAPPAVDTECRP